jgi:hypothetical protein
MTDEQREICEQAIEILLSCPWDSPVYRKRMELASNIEMQMLVGYPEYNDICLEKALEVIEAAANPAICRRCYCRPCCCH